MKFESLQPHLLN